MKKSIWLINQYAMPPKYEVRIQTLKRAEYLTELGYDVTIIGGSYLHNTNINLINDNSKYIKRTYGDIKFIHIKTNKYSSNGFRRFYNILVFTIRLFFVSQKFEKPNIVVQTATVPFGNLLYYMVRRLKAYYVVDVLDLWPESFLAYGLLSKNNPILKFAYAAEKWLYKRADMVVFSLEGCKDYIKEKGWDKESGGVIDLSKIHYINNGVDLRDFRENMDLFSIKDSDLDNDKAFNVVYIGSIRLANNLKQLIDAAALLMHNKKIRFLIYGDGEDREYLERYCKDKKIGNVIFKQKWVELKYVPYILSKSSLNILNYKHTPIDRFGGSQSKSFQYMASGKPICSNIEMAYCPIKKYNIGIAKKFKNSQEYADAILSFVDMNNESYEKMCLNAISAAEHYDYKKLTAEFVRYIK